MKDRININNLTVIETRFAISLHPRTGVEIKSTYLLYSYKSGSSTRYGCGITSDINNAEFESSIFMCNDSCSLRYARSVWNNDSFFNTSTKGAIRTGASN